MAGNHLESLVAEWYEFNGYFVRRNVKVGRRPQGGYECELDVVAFSPEKNSIVHVEPSLDADTWQERERRYAKKFRAGRSTSRISSQGSRFLRTSNSSRSLCMAVPTPPGTWPAAAWYLSESSSRK